MTSKYSMYGTIACPKCGSGYTWAGTVEKAEFNCTDCDHTEPLSKDNYEFYDEEKHSESTKR